MLPPRATILGSITRLIENRNKDYVQRLYAIAHYPPTFPVPYFHRCKTGPTRNVIRGRQQLATSFGTVCSLSRIDGLLFATDNQGIKSWVAEFSLSCWVSLCRSFRATCNYSFRSTP